VPVRNDYDALKRLQPTLEGFRENGHQLIVVDGDSRDSSYELAHSFASTVLRSEKGRAWQMNKGAEKAIHPLLWFIHADVTLPVDADKEIFACKAEGCEHYWGRFDVRMTDNKIIYKVIAALMNIRSRWSGIATGDQAIFVSAELFSQIGGYPNISLMEDISLSSQLKKISSPICIDKKVGISSRRWESQGVLKTIVLMWALRLAYFLGVDADKLYKHYYTEVQ